MFHIHLGLKLVNRLSNGFGFMELNVGNVNRSIIPIEHTKNDSTTHLPDDIVHDQLDCDLKNMMQLTSDKKLLLENEDEKVSDDDFYVDDFESDNDDDANDEQ